MSRLFVVFVLILGFFLDTKAQDEKEYYVTVNGNLLVPTANSSRYTYPIYGFSKDLAQPHMIGGFGVGVNMNKAINDKVHLKHFVHLSRTKYWDEAGRFGLFTEKFYSIGTSTILGAGSVMHLEVPGGIKVGTGLSTQILLKAKTNAINSEVNFNTEIKSYKRLLLALPIEVQVNKNKMQYAVRYEHSLVNAYNKNLKDYLDDRYGVLFFTVGHRIK